MSSAHTVRPSPVVRDGTSVHGWKITTVKGPIIADRDSDAFRQSLGEGCPNSLPEMLFDQNCVTLLHEPSGSSISLNARDALREWRQEGLPPLQVPGAKAWQTSRQQEIQQQSAVQLEYDWTYTTPYCGTLITAEAASQHDGSEPEAGASGRPCWQETTEQIDKGLLMERDPIIFYDDVILYESDLDDNGVCQLSAKLRVMPKCWLVLLRLWVRVDGAMVRLRETRLFCRHDLPQTSGTVLREVRHVEGGFKELRAAGAPDEGPAYTNAEAASAVFQAVAPIGVRLFKLEKLVL